MKKMIAALLGLAGARRSRLVRCERERSVRGVPVRNSHEDRECDVCRRPRDARNADLQGGGQSRRERRQQRHSHQHPEAIDRAQKVSYVAHFKTCRLFSSSHVLERRGPRADGRSAASARRHRSGLRRVRLLIQCRAHMCDGWLAQPARHHLGLRLPTRVVTPHVCRAYL
jgi:hypothetical protein